VLVVVLLVVLAAVEAFRVRDGRRARQCQGREVA
jgi:hypothetical protein